MGILMSVLLTVVEGFLAAATVGSAMNWPDAGSVFAIAIMGACILLQLRKKDETENEE